MILHHWMGRIRVDSPSNHFNLFIYLLVSISLNFYYSIHHIIYLPFLPCNVWAIKTVYFPWRPHSQKVLASSLPVNRYLKFQSHCMFVSQSLSWPIPCRLSCWISVLYYPFKSRFVYKVFVKISVQVSFLPIIYKASYVRLLY